MKAVTWQGKRDMRVEEVPDPVISEPTDAIIKVTSTGLCGSDLHLYEVLSPFMTPGDIVGHEPMGVVEEVGAGVTDLKVGDRVVVPFNVSCGSCWMCDQQLYSQCETTQNHEFRTGASFFGYSKLYGQVPGGQAELLRVPFADFLPIKVPQGPPDERFLYLSDVLPTAWQAVEYAAVPKDGTLLVVGLGPIGDMSARIALHQGLRVLGVDLVPERLARAQSRGVEVIDVNAVEDVGDAVRDRTGGRGADSVIDAVGLEAHGSSSAKAAQTLVGLLPDKIAEPMMEKAGVDRLAALNSSIDAVRRGGTLSIVGVYGGMADPIPMLTLFDKQIQIRQGQANVKKWTDDLMPLVTDDSDPLGVEQFATHRVPLEEAPRAYQQFQSKDDGVFKVVFKP
ncbi:MAG: Threonine dehydrogenase and related Zn-dependent dehydrogenases [uncultured Nocardioidaceae bacterium]|uniref:Threonine dehydrogenase and related Zn-dependent dehydrogenases n=1 Tax=uncultured Nocardioidaceae bacterium TaxID=253824 RepID=A0A6J4M5D5_9ACTN|nr:MAG: Threonine dehydrogenase and related Zn-dependent dehydrogenases [uncultured Nocardioidaceae bacterium]